MTQSNKPIRLTKEILQEMKRRKFTRNIILLTSIVIIFVTSIFFIVTKSNDVTINADVIGNYEINKSGSKLNPIIVDGKGAIVECIKVTGNYIIVRNFVVQNCKSHAIWVLGNNVQVENNTVRNSVTENGKGECRNEGHWGSGIKLGLGSHDIKIRGNKVYENCGEGIASTRSFNVLIENNQVWDNFSVGIYVDNSYDVIVSKNLVYCTGIYLREGRRPNGIVFAEELYEGWGTQRHDNSAINNLVHDCNTGIGSWESELSTGKEIRLLIEGNQIFNTIKQSISLNTINEDVVVRNNISDKPVYIEYPEGVTLVENIEATATQPLQTIP